MGCTVPNRIRRSATASLTGSHLSCASAIYIARGVEHFIVEHVTATDPLREYGQRVISYSS